MELQRLAVEILAVRNEMDRLIDKWAGDERPAIQRRLCEKLLELKRKKDTLTEQV